LVDPQLALDLYQVDDLLLSVAWAHRSILARPERG
jgi:hypothetical protein